MTVAQPTAWPATVFDVKQFGAEGDGVKDDTAAVVAALEEAAKAGGGIVHFPRGRYRLSDGLTIPRFTVLRGEALERTAQCDSCQRSLTSSSSRATSGSELLPPSGCSHWAGGAAALCWTDLPKPPEEHSSAGTNSFGLEDLTLYAQLQARDRRRSGRAAGSGRRVPAARLRPGRHLPRPSRSRKRWTPASANRCGSSTGGGDTVRLGGTNIEITDCDLYGSGRVAVPEPRPRRTGRRQSASTTAAGDGTAFPAVTAWSSKTTSSPAPT